MFWGGREGYQTLLNTDLKKELDNMVTICFCLFPFIRVCTHKQISIGDIVAGYIFEACC